MSGRRPSTSAVTTWPQGSPSSAVAVHPLSAPPRRHSCASNRVTPETPALGAAACPRSHIGAPRLKFICVPRRTLHSPYPPPLAHLELCHETLYRLIGTAERTFLHHLLINALGAQPPLFGADDIGERIAESLAARILAEALDARPLVFSDGLSGSVPAVEMPEHFGRPARAIAYGWATWIAIQPRGAVQPCGTP